MTKAYVLINCDLGSEKNVISSLKSLDDVTEVHGTLGLYDVVVKIESDSEQKIQNTYQFYPKNAQDTFYNDSYSLRR